MYDSSPLRVAADQTGAMSASAALASELASNRRDSRLTTLRSDGPLVLRPSHPKGPEPLTHRRRGVARVALAAATAGPLGGDSYSLDVHVGAGSTMVLTDVSAVLVLPGVGGAQSHMSITVHVEEGATFVWWPEPIIAARDCNHRHDVRISLAPSARMILREEVLLGRYGEIPGDFSSRLRVTCSGAALYDQQLGCGSAADGYDSVAVLGNNGAFGSVIAVDPVWRDTPPGALAFDKHAALTPLAGPGITIGAVASDSLELRELLTRGLNELGHPWAV